MSRFHAEQTLQIALAHHRAGRLSQAEGIYRQILSDHPNHSEALNRLGVLTIQTNRLELAFKLITRAIEIDPTCADYHSNLGESLRLRGRHTDAIAAFHRAIHLDPKLATAHHNLAITLADANHTAASIPVYRRAVQLNPDYPDAWNNLGVALAKTSSFEEAIASYRQAIKLKPSYPQAHTNLGNALAAIGQADQAVIACQTAVRLDPDSVQAHWNLAVVLLRQGDFARGLPEYEWRWKPPAMPRKFSQPQWSGTDLTGKTILLHAEQGFGDTIQFIRYAPMVAGKGARVILECQPELAQLFQSIPGIYRMIPQGEPLPDFDLQCPLMSLPLALGTTLESIPAKIPYLFSDPAQAQRWKSRINTGGKINVGLVWAGKSTHSNDPHRSIPLSQFAPLALPHVKFHSLQKGAVTHAPPPAMDWSDHTHELTHFADTAALISNLDLIIAVDTAVAHLAAALGKPVWLLLPFLADWRWLLNRSDSPWYPAMRLFRQPGRSDWAAVIESVRVELLQMRIEP